MKELDSYIIEKLKINKDTKLYSNITKISPSEADFKIIKTFFSNGDKYKEYFKDYSKSIRNKNTFLKYWIATMLITNSTPYEYKNTINSYPGNYAKEFVDKALDLGLTKKEIMIQYELNAKDYKFEVFNRLDDEYFRRVNDLIKNLTNYNNLKYTIELQYDIRKYGNVYSDKAKSVLNQRNGIQVIPFIVKANNKSILCELGYSGYTNYHYSVDGTSYMFAKEFINALENKLK